MIAVITVISRLLGLVRWLAQASALGASGIGDAYTGANIIPNVLFETAAGGALAGALIPVLAGPIARRAADQTRAIIAGALGWTLLVLVPLGVLLALLADPVALALNVGDQLRATTRFFVLVFSVQIPLYGLTVLAYAVLQAHRRFFWPAFAPILSSLVTIGALVWYGRMAESATCLSTMPVGALEVLAWGTTAGVVAMCLPALVVMARAGWLPAPRLRFPDGVAPRVRSLALAGVAGVAAQQVSVLVLNLVAGYSTVGTRIVLQWTQAIYLLPYAVLVVPLVTATFPRLSEWAARERQDRFAALSATTTRAVVVVAGMGAAVLAAAAPAVAAVFALLDRQQSALVSESMTGALTWMVPGLLGFAVMFHGQRTLYALERGRLALVAGALGWGVVSLAAVGGFFVVGQGGPVLEVLAAAVTLGMTVGGLVTVALVVRAAGRAALAGLARTAGVVVIAGTLGAVAGRWVVDSVIVLIGHGMWQSLGAGAGAGLVAVVMIGCVLYLGDRAVVRDVAGLARRSRTTRPAEDPKRDDLG